MNELFETIHNNNIDNIRQLLKQNDLVNERRHGDNWTALMLAAQYGHTETVKLLLDRGADVNTKTNYGNTALIKAAFYGLTEAATLLLDRGADIHATDNDGSSALMAATQNGHNKCLYELLEYGAKLPTDTSKIISTMKKEYWWTPMHTAVINNVLDQIQSFEYSESDIVLFNNG